MPPRASSVLLPFEQHARTAGSHQGVQHQRLAQRVQRHHAAARHQQPRAAGVDAAVLGRARGRCPRSPCRPAARPRCRRPPPKSSVRPRRRCEPVVPMVKLAASPVAPKGCTPAPPSTTLSPSSATVPRLFKARFTPSPRYTPAWLGASGSSAEVPVMDRLRSTSEPTVLPSDTTPWPEMLAVPVSVALSACSELPVKSIPWPPASAPAALHQDAAAALERAVGQRDAGAAIERVGAAHRVATRAADAQHGAGRRRAEFAARHQDAGTGARRAGRGVGEQAQAVVAAETRAGDRHPVAPGSSARRRWRRNC